MPPGARANVSGRRAAAVMPAEWERHDATWLAWPESEAHWPGLVETLESVYAGVVEALAEGEDVRILVGGPRAEERARKKLARARAGRVSFYRIPTGDIWIRDYGPQFVRSAGARPGPLLVGWRFNAWGGKYADLAADGRVPEAVARARNLRLLRPDFVLEGGSVDVNGRGAALVTEQCLLHPNRGAGRDRAAVEAFLGRYLGVRDTVWLKGGIAGDDTDGHVDDVARFTAPDTVVAAVAPAGHADRAVLEENLRRLEAARPGSRKLRVVPLALPDPVEASGERLPATYANFYVANACVLVPVFGDPRDADALRIFGGLFPDRRAVGVPCRDVIRGYGAVHCFTQQEPHMASGE
jgi:agmatine deiminase